MAKRIFIVTVEDDARLRGLDRYVRKEIGNELIVYLAELEPLAEHGVATHLGISIEEKVDG